MNPLIMLRNSNNLLIFLKMLTQLMLLLKLRDSGQVNIRNRFRQKLMKCNAMLMPSILSLLYFLYKYVKNGSKKRKLLTKPQSLIGLLNRYR